MAENGGVGCGPLKNYRFERLLQLFCCSRSAYAHALCPTMHFNITSVANIAKFIFARPSPTPNQNTAARLQVKRGTGRLIG